MATFVPRIDPVPLFSRLTSARHRLWFSAILRGLSLTLAVPLLLALLLGWLDWRLDMPALVRGIGLATVLGLVGLLAIRTLLRPLRESTDPFALARRVDRQYPHRRDELTSVIQFLESEGGTGSPDLRREAVNRGLLHADDYDLESLLKPRGARRAFLLLLLVFGLGAGAMSAAPEEASSAYHRLTEPFAGHRWTRLRLVEPEQTPTRIARGQAFELKVALSGRRPSEVNVALWLDGSAPTDERHLLETQNESISEEILLFRFESNQVPRSFRFRVRAYDADTGWHRVEVVAPPTLVPREGRPSPQVRLVFPRYTGRRAVELPDGVGIIEGIAGTEVTLRAAADRPLAEASIAYQPAQPDAIAATILAPLGSASPWGLAGSFRLSSEVWAPQPIRLDDSGQLLDITFTPRISGLYALQFTDTTGLPGLRLLDVRVLPDPAPFVVLDRPSAASDILTVTPAAKLPLRARAQDTVFALRSMSLEYRFDPQGTPQVIPFFDGEQLGAIVPDLRPLVAVGGGLAVPGEWMVPALGPRLPLRDWALSDELVIAKLKHPDGSMPMPGDRIWVRIAADDYDDVHGLKQPSRTDEIELRIASAEVLEAMLEQGMLQMRDDIALLRDRQREAGQPVTQAREQLGEEGELGAEELGALAQSEQLQRQVGSRLADPRDGLSTLADRLNQAAEASGLPDTPAVRRLRELADELDRLAEKEAPPIAPLIAAARTEFEQGIPQVTGRPDPLAEVERYQRRVEEGLTHLLERLEPWSGAGEARGQARRMLDELEELGRQTKQLLDEIPVGPTREQLPQEQVDALDRAADRQARQGATAARLANELARLAREKEQTLLDLTARLAELVQQATQPHTDWEARTLELAAENLRGEIAELESELETLRHAVAEGAADRAADALRQAADRIQQNRLSDASNQQAAAADRLRGLIESLKEPPAEGADLLMKKAERTAEQIQDVLDEQQSLWERFQAGESPADLAREQEQLRRLTRELREAAEQAQAEDAADALRRAEAAMEDAQRRLEQGESPGPDQQNALNELENAQQNLEQEQNPAEESLDRERAEEVTAEIQAIKERLEALMAQRERLLSTATEAKVWERELVASLQNLGAAHTSLAKDVRWLIEKHFGSAPVFGRMLGHAAGAMDATQKRIDQWAFDALDFPVVDAELDGQADREVTSYQQLAMRRLDQLLEAVKPEEPEPRDQAPAGQPPPMPPPDGGEPPPAGPSLPSLPELKALRALQAELNERTAAFDAAHPDPTQLDEAAIEELTELSQAQIEIAELIVELMPKDEPEGEEP